METSTIQQDRLQAIAEKRKRQTEIENKRRQLEDDRRQLQYLKSKALRERWLLEGTPSSNAEDAEATKKQMEDDDSKVKELESGIQRLEKELEQLENGLSASSTQENVSEEVRAAAKTAVGSAKETKRSNSPMIMAEGGGMMKAAMYSVEITVEKDKLTGETKVLSSTTRLPLDPSVHGVKVYEDETKVVHAVRAEDGSLENGLRQLSSVEVDELIHQAEEATLSEISERVTGGKPTPRKEIMGLQTKPVESPKLTSSGDGPEPSQDQPVTMIFMGYQNVEDADETKKALGLEGTIKAELVVIEDSENKTGAESGQKGHHGPPNGSAGDTNATGAEKLASQPGETPSAHDATEQDVDPKKPRCRCCSVM